jgi:hypothetical protein
MTTITTMLTIMIITTMTILAAQAAEAPSAIRTLTVPAKSLVYLLLQQLPIPLRRPLPLATLLYILL